MDRRDARRRSCSPRASRRGHRRSSTSSSSSSSSCDSDSSFSRHDRRCRRHNSRSRSRSPRSRSRSRDRRDAVRYGDTVSIAQRGRRQEDRNPRGKRRVDSAKASGEERRIAPNASALKALMLGTARSRDRMDERERARAQKKLEALNTTAKSSRK